MTGGLLLVRGRADLVGRWVSRGLVVASVTPLGPWTAVQCVDDVARSAPPYDDAVHALAARPLGRRLRPGIGLFATGGHGVVTVQLGAWRRVHRWLLWSPVDGPHTARHLPPVRPQDLLAAADVSGPNAVRDLRRALAAAPGDPLQWLAGLLVALGLPGSRLLTGDVPPRGPVIGPSARSVRAFDAMVDEDHAHRAELQEGP